MLHPQRLGSRAGAAGIADVFLPLVDFLEVRGQAPVCVKQIDLEAEAAAAREVVEHILQGGVGDEPAIPIVLAVDLHRRKAWRQGGAGHHMLRTDGGLIVVEKRKAAAAHVHGAYAETYCLGIDAVEIDQTLERTLERVRVVIAGKIWKRDPI